MFRLMAYSPDLCPAPTPEWDEGLSADLSSYGLAPACLPAAGNEWQCWQCQSASEKGADQ